MLDRLVVDHGAVGGLVPAAIRVDDRPECGQRQRDVALIELLGQKARTADVLRAGVAALTPHRYSIARIRQSGARPATVHEAQKVLFVLAVAHAGSEIPLAVDRVGSIPE